MHDCYLDDGVSGTIALGERAEGARLLADAEARKFGLVLIYRLDRLGRDPRLILNAVSELESLDIRVVSVTEPFDTSTPPGRFLLTMLSGVAGLERDTIRERSMLGTNRAARAGAWLGGIVPYGYRVEGKGRDARLVLAEEHLPDLSMSEADVVRLIYRQAVEERHSCQKIADYLNALGVPPAYVRDGRQVRHGKRKQATAGIWRPSRIRNLIVNPTYKGVHYYGRRSKHEREVIQREVLPIVTEETWEEAQEVLRANMLFSRRSAKNRYLLRGLIKCGLCGLTYIGTHRDERHAYYVCNGKHMARGLYGRQGKRCPSARIKADIEERVWREIDGFLRAPEGAVARLKAELEGQTDNADRLKAEAEQVKAVLAGKQGERDRVLSLFRRGKITQAEVDRQFEQVDAEETELRGRLTELEGEQQAGEQAEARLRAADDLLRDLHGKLSQPLTWELKRQLVETLVDRIQVDTVETDGQRVAVIQVQYRFGEVPIHTGKRAVSNCPRPALLSVAYSTETVARRR